MSDTVNWPTPQTARKVQAATAGSATGVPVGLVVAWGVNYLLGLSITEADGAAIAAVVTTAVASLSTWIAGYRTRERRLDVATLNPGPPRRTDPNP